jgi:hypothetical protein
MKPFKAVSDCEANFLMPDPLADHFVTLFGLTNCVNLVSFGGFPFYRFPPKGLPHERPQARIGKRCAVET